MKSLMIRLVSSTVLVYDDYASSGRFYTIGRNSADALRGLAEGDGDLYLSVKRRPHSDYMRIVFRVDEYGDAFLADIDANIYLCVKSISKVLGLRSGTRKFTVYVKAKRGAMP